MQIEETIQKIKSSFLPTSYQMKLCYDIQQIEKMGISNLVAIILFGSCARNEMREGSDLDLLIISMEPVAHVIRAELSSDLEEQRDGISSDILFYTETEFEKSISLLTKEIKKDGIILWEAH